MSKHLIAVALATTALSSAALAAPPPPGPSAYLFAHPYYRCVRNFHVSPSGSDANPGTEAAPYQTLQRPQELGELRPGDCVDAAPGTYARGVWVSAGGSAATATGYVTYRCELLDACTVTDTSAGGIGAFVWNNTISPMRGSYVIIDGFHLDDTAKTSSDSSGVTIATNVFVPSVHHVWIINSIVEGYGASGIQLNQGERFYVVHDDLRSNANRDCQNHGSGVSLAGLIATRGYQRTNDDLQNSVIGAAGAYFNNVVESNVIHNNALTCTQEKHYADGNGVVLDTLNWGGAPGTAPYLGGVLVALDVLYNNGGAGVNAYRSDNITVANNTEWHDNLNPRNIYSFRGGLMTSVNAVTGNVFINNVAVAMPGAHTTCAYYTQPYTMFNSAFLGVPYGPPDTFTHNVSMITGPSCAGENFVAPPDTYSCTLNRCATQPLFVNAGTQFLGTETRAPRGANFALKPGAPEIGYGLREPYLPATSIDVGACDRSLWRCGEP